MLGWNIAYEFNDSDFEVIIDCFVCLYLFFSFPYCRTKRNTKCGSDTVSLLLKCMGVFPPF